MAGSSKEGGKRWQVINSSSRGRCLKSDDARQLTWSFLIAEPSLLKWSSFAAFTVKRHFLWGLIFICRGRETTGGERRRVLLVAKAAGAGLLRRHVPNGDAILSRYLLQGGNLRVTLCGNREEQYLQWAILDEVGVKAKGWLIDWFKNMRCNYGKFVPLFCWWIGSMIPPNKKKIDKISQERSVSGIESHA